MNKNLFSILSLALLVTVFILAQAQPSQAAVVQLFNDSFNRANSPTVGGGWTQADGASGFYDIFNNKLRTKKTGVQTMSLTHSFSGGNTGFVTMRFNLIVVDQSAGMFHPFLMSSTSQVGGFMTNVTFFQTSNGGSPAGISTPPTSWAANTTYTVYYETNKATNRITNIKVGNTFYNNSGAGWTTENPSIIDGMKIFPAGAGRGTWLLDNITVWNGSIGQEPNVPHNVSIRAYTYWNNTQLSTFNVTLNGTVFRQASGSIALLPVQQGNGKLYNLTFRAPNYFPFTVNNVNLSAGSYNFTQVFQTSVRIHAQQILNNANLSNFSIITSKGAFSTTNGTVLFHAQAGNFSWNFTNTQGFFNQRLVNFNLVSCARQTCNKTVSNAFNSEFRTFRNATATKIIPTCVFNGFTLTPASTNRYRYGTLSFSNSTVSCTLASYVDRFFQGNASHYNASIFMANAITLKAKNFVNGSFLTIFNVTVDGSAFYSTITGNISTQTLSGPNVVHTYVFRAPGYFANSTSRNANLGGFSPTLYRTILNVRAQNLISGTYYNTFNASVIGGSQSGVTTTGLIVLHPNPGSYNLNVTVVGFPSVIDAFSISSLQTLNITALIAPSLSIFVRSATTGNLIQPQRVNLTLTGPSTQTNQFTTNGHFTLSNLMNSTIYNFLFTTANYTTGSYSFVYNGSFPNPFTAYLLTNGTTAPISFLVQDTSGANLENAYMTFENFVNGAYQVVGARFSNVIGQVIIDLVPGQVTRINVTKDGYVKRSFVVNLQDTINDPDYTIILDQTAGINFQGTSTGLALDYNPKNLTLRPVVTTFHWEVAPTASNVNISNFGISAYNGTHFLGSVTNTTGLHGGNITITLNLTNFAGDTIKINYFVTKVGFGTYTLPVTYVVTNASLPSGSGASLREYMLNNVEIPYRIVLWFVILCLLGAVLFQMIQGKGLAMTLLLMSPIIAYFMGFTLIMFLFLGITHIIAALAIISSGRYGDVS